MPDKRRPQKSKDTSSKDPQTPPPKQSSASPLERRLTCRFSARLLEAERNRQQQKEKEEKQEREKQEKQEMQQQQQGSPARPSGVQGRPRRPPGLTIEMPPRPLFPPDFMNKHAVFAPSPLVNQESVRYHTPTAVDREPWLGLARDHLASRPSRRLYEIRPAPPPPTRALDHGTGEDYSAAARADAVQPSGKAMLGPMLPAPLAGNSSRFYGSPYGLNGFNTENARLPEPVSTSGSNDGSNTENMLGQASPYGSNGVNTENNRVPEPASTSDSNGETNTENIPEPASTSGSNTGSNTENMPEPACTSGSNRGNNTENMREPASLSPTERLSELLEIWRYLPISSYAVPNPPLDPPADNCPDLVVFGDSDGEEAPPVQPTRPESSPYDINSREVYVSPHAVLGAEQSWTKLKKDCPSAQSGEDWLNEARPTESNPPTRSEKPLPIRERPNFRNGAWKPSFERNNVTDDSKNKCGHLVALREGGDDWVPDPTPASISSEDLGLSNQSQPSRLRTQEQELNGLMNTMQIGTSLVGSGSLRRQAIPEVEVPQSAFDEFLVPMDDDGTILPDPALPKRTCDGTMKHNNSRR
ncbi:hypothetical protein BJX99DRAFT_257798 [Aspergillus californicus]